jgi:dihydrofolate reductase
MRTLVVSTIASLDGFTAGVGGDLSVLPFDDGFNTYCVERLRTADTLLLGRRTFEEFHAYWPGVADDPRRDPVEREASRLNGAMRKVVVSDSLTLAPDTPWFPTTTVVSRAAAPDAVRELLAGDGGDVLTFGSATTWNALLAAGVAAELHVLVGPAMVGEGLPLFTGPRTPLRLLGTRQLAGSSLVLNRYAAGSA